MEVKEYKRHMAYCLNVIYKDKPYIPQSLIISLNTEKNGWHYQAVLHDMNANSVLVAGLDEISKENNT